MELILKEWLDRTPPKFALIPAIILIGAVLNLYVPYLSLQPGPTTDVNKIISARGATTYAPKGKLLLTTVGFSRYRLRVVDAIRAGLNPNVDVIPIELYIPKGKTPREIDRENSEEIDQSKQAAAAAALSHLGYPVRRIDAGALIEAVERPGPSAGILEPGDVVQSVDKHAIPDTTTFVHSITSKPIGTQLKLGVLRDGKRIDLAVKSGRRAQQPTIPRIGVSVTDAAGSVELPVAVEFRTGRVGGPSAGLFFSLGVVDLLQPGDLTRGKVVAGTGTIDATGKVGPVGGVRQKVVAARKAGADVFICPAEEAADAKKAAKSMRVIGVKTLGEAVAALEKLRD